MARTYVYNVFTMYIYLVHADMYIVVSYSHACSPEYISA